MNRFNLRSIGIAVLGVSMLTLTACNADAVDITYEGPYGGEVAACSEIASGGLLRSDDGVPSRIWIDLVFADQSEVSASGAVIRYTVSGRTHATDASGEQVYEWDCELTKSFFDKNLNATLISFKKVP